MKIVFIKSFYTFDKNNQKILIKKGDILKQSDFLYNRLNDFLNHDSGNWVKIIK